MIKFTCEDKYISSHVKISMTSYVLPSLAFKFLNQSNFISIQRKHLQRLLGNIRQPSVILGDLRVSSEIVGICVEIFGKLLKSFVVYMINRILHVRLWIRILSYRV